MNKEKQREPKQRDLLIGNHANLLARWDKHLSKVFNYAMNPNNKIDKETILFSLHEMNEGIRCELARDRQIYKSLLANRNDLFKAIKKYKTNNK